MPAPPRAASHHPGTAVPEGADVLAPDAAQGEVQLLGDASLEPAREVELEAVSRHAAELASPVGLGRGPQDDGAGASAGLLQPDEEPPAVLVDEAQRLGGCDDVHHRRLYSPVLYGPDKSGPYNGSA